MEKQQVVEISPLSKWKRILSYLGDFFLMFMLSFFLMNLAVYPSAALMFNKPELARHCYEAECLRDDVLFDNRLLFFENDFDKYDYQKSLSYTYDKWLGFQVGLEGTEYEVIKNYYVDIKGDQSAYKAVYEQYDESLNYFVFDEGIVLRSDIKNILRNGIEEDNPSIPFQEAYYNLLEKGFLPMYGALIRDIQANDLHSGDVSFNEQSAIASSYDQKIQLLYSGSSIVAMALSWAGLFVLIPLFSRNGNGVTAWVSKFEKVGADNLLPLSRLENLLSSVYQLPLNMASLLLLPMSYIPASNVFGLPLLGGLSAIGLIVMIASLIVVLFDPYNRGISDLLSRSIYIDSANLEAIKKARGIEE